MTTKHFDKTYGTDAAQNYEDLFVPRIGRPSATALVGAVGVQPGERVLDVACGTGIAARLAAEATGPQGSVTGVDINAGMLAVARSVAPDIHWREAPADALPVEDGSADVVICNLGLMFFPDKPAALAEMHRALSSPGRAGVLVPGPTPAALALWADALARHIDPGLQGFVHAVFSLHDSGEIEALFRDAGFSQVDVKVDISPADLGPPREFFWDYLHATPLGGPVLAASSEQRAALEDEVLNEWERYVVDGELVVELRNTIAIATR